MQSSLIEMVPQSVNASTRRSRIHSGVQPSGRLHLGNYRGAVHHSPDKDRQGRGAATISLLWKARYARHSLSLAWPGACWLRELSHALAQWARDNLIEVCFIQPGKPTQNALIERFNRMMRTEVLDRYIFNSMTEVRQMIEDWRHRYNNQRPHSALGGLPLAKYAMAHSTSSSTSE
jgi:hypothetical protein